MAPRLKKEEIYNKFWFTVLLIVLLMLVGMVVYRMSEGWSYFNSLYFTVITITTIGYGDFVPVTIMGKIFTMIFPFLGIGMAFYLFSVTGRYVFTKAMDEIEKFSSSVVKK